MCFVSFVTQNSVSRQEFDEVTDFILFCPIEIPCLALVRRLCGAVWGETHRPASASLSLETLGLLRKGNKEACPPISFSATFPTSHLRDEDLFKGGRRRLGVSSSLSKRDGRDCLPCSCVFEQIAHACLSISLAAVPDACEEDSGRMSLG